MLPGQRSRRSVRQRASDTRTPTGCGHRLTQRRLPERGTVPAGSARPSRHLRIGQLVQGQRQQRVHPTSVAGSAGVRIPSVSSYRMLVGVPTGVIAVPAAFVALVTTTPAKTAITGWRTHPYRVRRPVGQRLPSLTSCSAPAARSHACPSPVVRGSRGSQAGIPCTPVTAAISSTIPSGATLQVSGVGTVGRGASMGAAPLYSRWAGCCSSWSQA